jgi:hypothetical protein
MDEMINELNSLRESLKDIDSLNASQDVKESMKNEIQYAIMCIDFTITEMIWKQL